MIRTIRKVVVCWDVRAVFTLSVKIRGTDHSDNLTRLLRQFQPEQDVHPGICPLKIQDIWLLDWLQIMDLLTALCGEVIHPPQMSFHRSIIATRVYIFNGTNIEITSYHYSPDIRNISRPVHYSWMNFLFSNSRKIRYLPEYLADPWTGLNMRYKCYKLGKKRSNLKRNLFIMRRSHI
jgi:hypothetical protein